MFKKQLAKLINVKTIITLIFTLTVAYMALKGTIKPEEITGIYSIILIYFFQKQETKKEENKKDDEDETK